MRRSSFSVKESAQKLVEEHGFPTDVAKAYAGAYEPSGAELAAQSRGEALAHARGANGSVPNFTTLSVTIGAETHSPTKYHSFTIGPFSASVSLEPGEDVEYAYLRARARLTALVETEFLLRVKEFEDHRKRSRG